MLGWLAGLEGSNACNRKVLESLVGHLNHPIQYSHGFVMSRKIYPRPGVKHYCVKSPLLRNTRCVARRFNDRGVAWCLLHLFVK